MATKTIYVNTLSGQVSNSKETEKIWEPVTVTREDGVDALDMLVFAVYALDNRYDKKALIRDAINRAKQGKTVYDMDCRKYYVEHFEDREGKVLSDMSYRLMCIKDTAEMVNEVIEQDGKWTGERSFYDDLEERFNDYMHDYACIDYMTSEEAFNRIESLATDLLAYLKMPGNLRAKGWQKDLLAKKSELVNLSFMYVAAYQALRRLNKQYDTYRNCGKTDIALHTWYVVRDSAH